MNPASMQKMTKQRVGWYFLSEFYRRESPTWDCRRSTEVPVTQLPFRKCARIQFWYPLVVKYWGNYIPKQKMPFYHAAIWCFYQGLICLHLWPLIDSVSSAGWYAHSFCCCPLQGHLLRVWGPDPGVHLSLVEISASPFRHWAVWHPGPLPLTKCVCVWKSSA